MEQPRFFIQTAELMVSGVWRFGYVVMDRDTGTIVGASLLPAEAQAIADRRNAETKEGARHA